MNRLRLMESRIPMRLRALRMDSPEVSRLRVDPRSVADNWMAAVRAGEVVQAEGAYRSCGKGIWARGDASTAFLAASLLDLMETDDTGARVMYLTTDEYLQSMRPDGDLYLADSAAESAITLLAHVPALHFLTDWGRSTISSLLIKRFVAGLPTLVSALHPTVAPDDFVGPGLGREAVLLVEIMDPK